MSETKKFDLAVIGAGPGGYVAAIKAAQMGKKVALIERKYLGGTCLNVGCIPSKAMLASASVYTQVNHAKDFGVNVGSVSFDYAKMTKRKNDVVEKIRTSLGGLLKSNGITIFNGDAQFTSPNSLKVLGEDEALISATSIVIATGSEPVDIPAFPCDHKLIRNSTSILELTELPDSIAVIGGGYIGCEFASLFIQLGVKVTIIEALPSIVQAQGKTVSSALTSAFKKQGIDIRTNTAVETIEKKGDSVTIHLKGGEKLDSGMAIVAVGRRLNSKGLGLEKAGLTVNKMGAIEVNEKMETAVPGIYAIGDITGKAMLAHVASHQGIVAAANACGQAAHIHYNAVPAVIFTHPEIACVGMTAEEAKEQGYQTSIGRFPFQALGKAVATRETDGFAEVITDKQTGEILGAQVVGHGASVMIGEMGLAISNELTLDCIADTIHAHPTMPEAWLEAALLANDTPIHFPPKIR